MNGTPGATPEAACSLGTGELADRSHEFRRLAAGALLGRERTADGLVLRFQALTGVEDALRDLARREKECCPFFESAIERHAGEVRLGIRAPAAAQAIVDSIYAAAGAARP